MADLALIVGGFISIWLIVAWLACALFSGYLAEQKLYCWPCWLIMGVIFGPVALVAAAGLPDRHVVVVIDSAEAESRASEAKKVGFRAKGSDAYGVIILVLTLLFVVLFYAFR